MNRIRIALALGVLLAAPSAAATKLTEGKWTGQLLEPNQPPRKTSYNVEYAGSALKITMFIAGEPFEFSDIKVNRTQLQFHWDAGSLLKAKLTLGTHGSFEGPCFDSKNKEICRLTMKPPETAADAEEPVEDQEDKPDSSGGGAEEP